MLSRIIHEDQFTKALRGKTIKKVDRGQETLALTFTDGSKGIFAPAWPYSITAVLPVSVLSKGELGSVVVTPASPTQSTAAIQVEVGGKLVILAGAKCTIPEPPSDLPPFMLIMAVS